jgi:hypothetical protein
MIMRHVLRGGAAAAAALLLSGYRAANRIEPPETVMVTYHAKPGSEDELARVLAEHWSTAKRLGLVSTEPHVVVRSAEAGRPVDFVEIFTWRDASIPDNAPEPIRAAWDRMNKLVESRGGHPGIEFAEVKVVL